MHCDQISGVVLAGGKGSRIGRDKAKIRFCGETLLNIAVMRLSEIFSEVIVVVDDLTRFTELPFQCLQDHLPGLGPIGGIETALRAVSRRAVFVVACDMPFLKADAIRMMIDLSDNYDLVIPSLQGGLHPLHALYTQDCLPAIRAQIRAGNLAPHCLTQHVRSRLVHEESFIQCDPHLQTVVNINTPEDLAQASRLIGDA